MRSRRPWFVAVIPAILVSPLAGQSARYTLSGTDVAVYNLVGEMRVEAGSGSAVVVEVTRHGADAGRLSIENGELNGRQTLRVIFPGDRIVYAPLGRHSQSQIRVRDDGTFEGRGGREVTVTGDGSGLDAYADLRVLVPAGQRVSVNLAVGHVTVSNVNGQLSVDASSADVEASGTRGTLSVDVGSGSVGITDAQGDVSIDTGSGDVTLTGIRGDNVNVDTGSGNVTGTRLGGTGLKIETGSGDVHLSAVSTPDARIETGSGTIELQVDATLRTFHGETGSGDVTIRAPGSLSAIVDLETSSGDISTDFDVAVTRREEDHIIGRIGDGRGKISIDTGSGDVRLVRE
jgi:lia operon protein LiaG